VYLGSCQLWAEDEDTTQMPEIITSTNCNWQWVGVGVEVVLNHSHGFFFLGAEKVERKWGKNRGILFGAQPLIRACLCWFVCKRLKARQTMSMTSDTWPFSHSTLHTHAHTHTGRTSRTHTYAGSHKAITINILSGHPEVVPLCCSATQDKFRKVCWTKRRTKLNVIFFMLTKDYNLR